MIAELPIAATFAHHAGTQARHIEADLRQGPAHHAVHFIAPAAAPLQHELVECRLEVEVHRAAQLHIEILEGDGVLMRAMQRRQVGSQRAVDPDASQIRGKVHGRLD